MNGLATQSLSLHFSPLIPVEALFVFGFIIAVLIAAQIITSHRIPFLRALSFAAFLFILSGPSVHEEKREAVPGIVALIVDESASQSFGERTKRRNAALQYIENTLGPHESFDLRVSRAPLEGALAGQSNLFTALEEVFADVPESQRAGAIFISDGQIHDIPGIEAIQSEYGPVHLLITGEKNETDRRIVITNAPAFGIVGQDISVNFRIEDSGKLKQANAHVTLRLSDGTERRDIAPIGEEHTITLPVQHAGQNVFELSVEGLPGELTARNNKVAIDFQGVRDRLRVLLVSGKPHAGGRTWRDLLTADPSVDLVHFTILREPSKIDATPQNEMSLIAFPFRELFELKLYDFDLIIFDRYRISRILPDHYFQNIARYVEEGGAFLEASGPAYAGEDSIYYTALNKILPGTPNGEVFTQSFTPAVSALGKNHPVTRSLVWKTSGKNDQGSKGWGNWLRQIGLTQMQGDILMNGIEEKPLLIINRVGEGRVAQIASDHIWLWSRGYDGGGPHAELLRRTVHWLMKEPELDEEALDVQADGRTLIIRRAAFERSEDIVSVTKPDGQNEEITLTPSAEGVLEHLMRAEQTGIYRFETEDGKLRFVVVGDIDPPEFRNVLSSAKALTPLMDKTGGKDLWLESNARPRIRFLKSAPFAGHGWLGLKDNAAYRVTGALEKPALPPWLALGLLLALGIATWFYEGRKI